MRRIVIVFVLVMGFASMGLANGISIAPKIGVLFPESPFGTGFAIGAVGNVAQVHESISIHPALTYWTAGGDEGGVDYSLSNFQIAADGHYYVKDLPGFYAGLGLSINFLSVDVEIPTTTVPGFGTIGGGTVGDSDTEIGIDILAGYELPIADRTGFIEGRYQIISDVNTFEIAIGLYFDIAN